MKGGATDPCALRDRGSGEARGTGLHVYYAGPGNTPSDLSLRPDSSAAHLVLRVTLLPGTVRCEIRKTDRWPTWSSQTVRKVAADKLGKVTCYIEVRVNEYILGTGPPTLTLVLSEVNLFQESASEAQRWRKAAERDLVEGDNYAFGWVPEDGIEGLELIQFVGPAGDYGIEALQTFGGLPIYKKDDGTVVVLHTYYDYWRRLDYERYRSQIEWSLADFKALIGAAHQQRVTEWGGRVGPDSHAPVVHTDANTLHDFYVNIGAYDHPDGPPEPPPSACNLAVPDHEDHQGLVRDCQTLLDIKDAFRGTAALNWSFTKDIEDWDGVKIRDGRVTDILLAESGLTGTIPAHLANLTSLRSLSLSRNALTGELPAELGGPLQPGSAVALAQPAQWGGAIRAWEPGRAPEARPLEQPTHRRHPGGARRPCRHADGASYGEQSVHGLHTSCLEDRRHQRPGPPHPSRLHGVKFAHEAAGGNRLRRSPTDGCGVVTFDGGRTGLGLQFQDEPKRESS